MVNNSTTGFLFLALIISVVINLVMFLPAYLFQTDKLTDGSYAITFIAVGLFAFFDSERATLDKVLLLMILLWSIRIGVFLVSRIWKSGKDTRFDEMRTSFTKFLRFWILQAVAVWLILIPSILYFGSTISPSFGLLALSGILIWGAGLLVESVADLQKRRFSAKNTGKWIDEGLWKYSRHPNYLGEIMVWLGVYAFCWGGLSSGQRFIGLIGPLFIIGLLCFVSGIPLLEKSADKKWGKIKEYQEYKNKTGILLPKL